MRFRIVTIVSLVFFAVCVLMVPAQDNNFVEAWFLYEKGKAKIEDPDGPELGEALLLFQEAIEKRGGTFPEAEMAIGDIYAGEGAYALAKRQYEKAYELRTGMEVAEEKYVVLYRLAELQENRELFRDMQDYLHEVLKDQPYFNGEQFSKFQNAFLSTYFEKGLDHLFKLYRMEEVAFAASAHSRLGWFYYRTGLYTPTAIMHNLFALDIIVTEAMQEIRTIAPDYEFSTVVDFLDASFKRENLSAYLVESEFVKIMYYLATSTYAASYPSLANSTWRILASYPFASEVLANGAGVYVDLSRRQLESPWVDPYINTSSRSIEFPQQ